MSDQLASILDNIRQDYVHAMTSNGEVEPYLTAYHICQQKLWFDANALARLIQADPKLLSARASDLIDDADEQENPSVGVIISSNIIAAAMEGLLVVAVNRDWLKMDDEGQVMINAEELDRVPEVVSHDYSDAGIFSPEARRSRMSILFDQAERTFIDQLEEGPHDAYQLALSVASDYALFAPDDLAPLIVENPLLLGLRADEMLDEDLFEGDPPAGLIISAHLTELLVHQLVDRAKELGAVACDSSGVLIMSNGDEDNPTVH